MANNPQLRLRFFATIKAMSQKRLVSILVVLVIILAGAWILKNTGSQISAPQTVSTPQTFEAPKPTTSTVDLKLSAASAISVWVSSDGSQEEVLFEKNAGQQRLIASLTKLMTADIVLENYDLSEDILVSKRAVAEGGYFKLGDVFSAKDLLYTMLIGQDNIAAYALSEKMGTDTFVALMNQKAKDLGLSDTYYSNAVGSGLKNHSTVNDLVTLIKWILKNQPSIFAISITPEFHVYNFSGSLRYTIKNADSLLTDPSIRWADQIIGSKMANNTAAGQCLVLVLKSTDDNGYLINIVLKSKDRFGDMKNLVNWAYSSYRWSQ